MGQSSTGLIFSITMNSQSSKFYLHSLLRICQKYLFLDLKKRGHFFQILLYVQSVAILVSQGLTP